MKGAQARGWRYVWLTVGITASIILLASLTNGEIYDWLDFRNVERKSEPVRYWFLFVGHIILAVGGIRVFTKWEDPDFQSNYHAMQVRYRNRAQREKRVSKANIIPMLLWAIVLAFVIVIILVFV